jgi:hypothetical protein
MPGQSPIPFFIFEAVLFTTLFFPGYSDAPPLERPKKGFWKASDPFWPFRKAYRDLWPVNAALMRAFRIHLAVALFLSGALDLSLKFVPAVAHAFTPAWLLIECGVIGLLVGRSSGFWSADRRLRASAKKTDETA